MLMCVCFLVYICRCRGTPTRGVGREVVAPGGIETGVHEGAGISREEQAGRDGTRGPPAMLMPTGEIRLARTAGLQDRVASIIPTAGHPAEKVVRLAGRLIMEVGRITPTDGPLQLGTLAKLMLGMGMLRSPPRAAGHLASGRVAQD